MGQYNIRVYGIYVTETNKVLLTDEQRFGLEFTKFPGGGLQQGEGTIDCLKREWQEELKAEIEVVSHFYTTDYYQVSAFDETEQLLSIYYRVQPLSDIVVPLAEHPFDIGEGEEQCFRLQQLEQLSPEDVKFPVDKKVVTMLRERFIG